MAKQNTAAPAAPSLAAQTSPNNALNSQSAIQPPVTSSVDQTAQPSNGQQPVNPYAGNFAAQFPGMSSAAQNMFPNQIPTTTTPIPTQNPLAQLMQQPPAANTVAPDPIQQINLIQLLAAQGIPQDQWATALQILSLSNAANPGMGNMNPAAALAAFGQMPAATQNAWGAAAPVQDVSSRDRERDRDRDHDYVRSPPSQYRRRSRSPGWDRRRDASPPRRRDSPVYGEYHGDSPGRNRGGDARGRRGNNDYRQRSPPGRRRRSPSPPRKDGGSLPPPGPKHLEYDHSIGQGNIKGWFPYNCFCHLFAGISHILIL